MFDTASLGRMKINQASGCSSRANKDHRTAKSMPPHTAPIGPSPKGLCMRAGGGRDPLTNARTATEWLRLCGVLLSRSCVYDSVDVR
jgi:hypothetical protein